MGLLHPEASQTFSSTNFPCSIQHQKFTEDECKDYGADRHAAAARRDLTAHLKHEQYEKPKLEPLIRTLNVDPLQKTSKTKRIYKKRKATHTVRKEEIRKLELEVTELKKQLEMLKFQTLEKGDENQSDRKLKAKNTLLRDRVQEQHLVLARAQAMFSRQSQQSRHILHPTEIIIRLGTDRNTRRTTLSALREPKLEEARRFLMERTRGLSPIAPYFQEERYDTMDGDYCMVRFDVTPFRGARNVQEVFSALQQAIFNAEIIFSESSGNITIREDDELGDDNLSHMRFLSQNPLGVQLETNLVLFSDAASKNAAQCQTKGIVESGCYAIMASDFVDEDTKYPYKPNERIRRDSTTVTMVTSYRGIKDDGESELVVVVTRWALNILRRPAFSISRGVWDDLRNSYLGWTDLMFNCVRQTLGLPVIQ